MRTRLLLLIGLLLVAAATRLYHLQTQSIWFDEGWSAYAAAQPTLEAIINADATNPPLYYLLLNIAARGFGAGELALRYVSLLLDILVIPLAYQLARRVFSPAAGIGAAFLVAASPLLWWASQEARMYTLLAILVLFAALAWHELFRRPSRGAWLTLWASELALLYAHNTGPVIALWLNIVTLLLWITRILVSAPHFRFPLRPNLFRWIKLQKSLFLPPLSEFGDANAAGGRGEVFIWFAGQLLVFLLWSPWFIARFLLLPQANSALGSAPRLNPELLGQLWAALWLGTWPMVIQPGADLAGYTPVVLALVFATSALLIPWRKPAARWLIAHIAILTGGLIVGLAVLGNEMHGRYLVMIAPLLLVVIGAGLGEGLAGRRIRRASSVPYLLATALFVGIFLVGIHFVTQNSAYQHDDARGMVRYYADHLTAADSVLAWSYADRYDLAYYWDRLGVTARRVTLPEGADLDAILPLLPTGGDVALNIWYTQRADYRGMMGCLLGAGTVNEPEQVSFYGMTNALYRAPSLDLPELRAFNAAISDIANLNAVGALSATTADRALCLPLQIQLTQPTTADLKAAVIVQNHLGWEVARDDAPFADAAQRTTSNLGAGDTLTAYLLLRLPYGVPPGDYTVFLRVYDEQAQPSGYDVFAGEDVRPVRDLQLGRWTVRTGADWSAVDRSTGLPVARDLAIGDDLILVADDIQGGAVHNGDELRLALLWRGQGELPDLTLADKVDTWQVAVPPPLYPGRGDVLLDWRAARIPLDAASGEAELRLPDGTVLGTYVIESTPAIFEVPPFDIQVDATFMGVGVLVGYSLGDVPLDRNTPFDVTLVWRAEQPTAASYTVFVQLIGADGAVIAQADAIPAANTRPTTGWRPGEYIVDVQRLTFNAAAQPGTARLIAGLYDPTTGVRVPLAGDGDFIILDESVQVR